MLDWLVLLGVLAGNDFTQDIKINVVQFVDIQTGDGFLVLAEPGVERLCTLEVVAGIEGQIGLSRRKTRRWHLTRTSRFVDIVDRPESDDRRPPHDRLKTSHLLVDRERNQGIRTTARVFDCCDEVIDGCRGWFGLVFSHLSLLSRPQY